MTFELCCAADFQGGGVYFSVLRNNEGIAWLMACVWELKIIRNATDKERGPEGLVEDSL